MGQSYTGRQWGTMVVVAGSHFCSAICSSLQAPFYPLEAEKKGSTATEYGFVFGAFFLTVFLISPIFGQYLSVLGAKFVFVASDFVIAVCTLLFGTLDAVQSHDGFIGLSFAVRIVEAVGNAGYLTASFAYLAAEFPDSIATVFASLETFYGLGLIAGPALGGALYEVGGFFLPFATFGAILLVVSSVALFILPTHTPVATDEQDPFFLLRILRIPGVFLAACAVTSSSITTGFVSATLEPHLRQFGLSHILVGSVFMIEGATYAITAPLWGRISDRFLSSNVVIIIGSVCIGIGFTFIGPLAQIPLPTYLWLSCVSLIFNGAGSGALLVAGFLSGLKAALSNGFPADLRTYGTLSGMWSSSFALGSFVGPSVAGYLFDHVGFRMGSWFVLACQMLLILLMSVYMIFGRRPNREKSVEPGLFSEKSTDQELTESTSLLKKSDSQNVGYTDF